MSKSPSLSKWPKLLRILVVDDNEADVVYVRELLAQVDGVQYRVDWASNGEEALQLLDQEIHDLYLFDQSLDGTTGIDLLRRARRNGVVAPIIMLTGRDDDALDLSAMAEGASDFMVKSELSVTSLERSIRYAAESHRLLVEMERTAKQDALTGLANRRHFQEFLEGAIARARRSDQIMGLLLIDLDHFKEINDQHGHDAGDRFLIDIAERLTHTVRQGDLVARLGGDEFAVVLDNLSCVDNAALVAANILSALEKPCPVGGVACHVAASVGVAVYPDAGHSVNAMFKAADTAMYEAKAQGRNRFQCFERHMQEQALRRAELHRALESALAKRQISVHYQAQFVLPEHRLVGLEALARWEKEGEYVTPAEFIPIAENAGLIELLGEQVLSEACRQFQRWIKQGLLPVDARVAVNVSVRQLVQGDFSHIVERVLGEARLPATRLELEITESSPIHDLKRVVRQLEQISALGVHVALDDFGTGHASLTHLQHLPVQTLKIDQSFVRHCAQVSSERVLIEGTLGMAHALGMQVIAEGVEIDAQRDFLLGRGCTRMQGFLLHRPSTAEAVEVLLREWAAAEPVQDPQDAGLGC